VYRINYSIFILRYFINKDLISIWCDLYLVSSKKLMFSVACTAVGMSFWDVGFFYVKY